MTLPLFIILHIIQIELERLNHANEAINQLENQLDVILNS